MKKIVIQASFFMVAIACASFLAHNVAANISRQGIATGFDFLSNTSGFAIIQILIPYSEASTYGRAFVVGLFNTFLVSILAIVASTLFGFAIGISRLSANWLVAKLATIYVELVRNIPLLLQIFFWYFVVLRALPVPRFSINYLNHIFINNRGIYLPAFGFSTSGKLIALAIACSLGIAIYGLTRGATRWRIKSGGKFSLWYLLIIFVATGLGLFAVVDNAITIHAPILQGFNFSGGIVVLPELAALLMGLSFYTSAFIAEIVRAGILGIHRGQREAAYSLGMTPNLTMRLVILPQAMRIIVPPLTSQYLNVVKNSSLAAAIGYPDLVAVFAGTVLNQTGQAVEVLLITMLVYLSISLAISLFMNWHQASAKWAEP